MAAAREMNAGDREAMIHGMVERLASRLKQNGDDIDGWLRLVKAYLVMGDRDKAKAALHDARRVTEFSLLITPVSFSLLTRRA